MKQLGPYKKYIIAAAIIQSIIVVLIGYVLFKSRSEEKTLESSAIETSRLEIASRLSAHEVFGQNEKQYS